MERAGGRLRRGRDTRRCRSRSSGGCHPSDRGLSALPRVATSSSPGCSRPASAADPRSSCCAPLPCRACAARSSGSPAARWSTSAQARSGRRPACTSPGIWPPSANDVDVSRIGVAAGARRLAPAGACCAAIARDHNDPTNCRRRATRENLMSSLLSLASLPRTSSFNSFELRAAELARSAVEGHNAAAPGREDHMNVRIIAMALVGRLDGARRRVVRRTSRRSSSSAAKPPNRFRISPPSIWRPRNASRRRARSSPPQQNVAISIIRARQRRQPRLHGPHGRPGIPEHHHGGDEGADGADAARAEQESS